MSLISRAEIYRREAERLRAMADAFAYYEAREEFLNVADHFHRLAEDGDAATSSDGLAPAAPNPR